MPPKILKNKPLIEAILEMRWELRSPEQGMPFDPHFKILFGRLYDRVGTEYPEIERLPAATLPDEFAGHVAQFRFRHGTNDWPLIQAGPGVVTLNETQKYIWEDFRQRSISLVRNVFESHPKPPELKVQQVLLRYIDAVEFDYNTENVFKFLQEKMHVEVNLPTSLFADTSVIDTPKSFGWESSFDCQKPKGRINVRFAIGEAGGKPALVWETMMQSSGPDVPKLPDEFANWIDNAHTIIDDWFFKLIEGDLEKRFSGE